VAVRQDRDALDAPEAGTAALRGGALRSGGYALGVALSLASAPVLIHHLGVEGFGRYATVTALVALVAVGSEAGLNAIALRELSRRGGAERAPVMRDLLGVRLVVTSAGMAGAVAFAALAGYDETMVLGTLVAGAGLVLASAQALLAVPLQAQLRFGWATLIELARQVVTVALIIALALAGASLGPFFAIPLAAAIVTLAATIVLVRGTIPLRPSFDAHGWGALLRDTLPYAAATAVYAAYFRVALIIVSLRSSELETGFFATSFRVIDVVVTVPAVAVTAAFPVLARAERDDRTRFDRAATRMVDMAVPAGVLTALGLVLAAPVIVDILAPASGEPAAAVLRIQALAMIPAFVSVACVFPLLSLGRQRAILAINAGALAASVVLTLILVGPFDARGAAAATVAAEVVLATASFAVVRADVPALRSVLASLPLVLGAGAAGAAVLLVPGLPDVADIPAGLAVFAVLLVLTGRVPPELREILSRGGSARRPAPE
jgi:O-antigen/teichoic acid export membrane protein